MSSCHNHQSCINNAISKAEMICSDHNAQLTPLRKKVFELVWQNGHNAVKAYDLLDKLKDKEPSAKPNTIYRALDFLMENKLIHKIESQNSFIGCNHPSRQHKCAFLICEKCMKVEECCGDDIIQSIASSIDSKGFTINNITLEISGFCDDCSCIS